MSTRLGIIFGNRNFFSDHLVTEARNDFSALLDEFDVKGIMLDEDVTKLGGVETYRDAEKCADLFKQHRDEIEGIVVVLPNFGDEKGIADTIRLADLDVPVLITAYPDELEKMDVVNRRDAFCGKISVCNNLYQYGIPFTLTQKHVDQPYSDTFRSDLNDFIKVCKVVNGLRNIRIGAIGARPSAFNTVRYSEKILERNRISVVTADLSEILGDAEKISNDEARVEQTIEKIKEYSNTGLTTKEALQKIARMDIVLQDFVEEHKLDATAIQCWTSVQQNYGCNVCTSMSMMSENMLPSACEVDVTGTLTMYAMQLASDSPSALVDWNNNYAEDEEKCVLFHCGNWAKSFLPDATISTAPILGTAVGEENTVGAMEGRTPASELTFGRLSTDDTKGIIKAYFGEGELTDDPLNTFGTRAVAKIPNLQELMQFVCKNGFEHHVVMNASKTAKVLEEAVSNYLGWDVHTHKS
ncbi:MAG: fucose isomerase [Bacteroidetes bacterium]|jgi:L-fucose isomerase-like protein|nr:fucose isomerase [Bacteroidota bacterium]